MRFKIVTIFLFLLYSWSFIAAQKLRNEPISNLNYIVKEIANAKNLIILIHGYGSNEKDLFSFANRFSQTTVVCVRGPITKSTNAYSWYDIEFKSDGNHVRNLNQALNSETMLFQFISAIENRYKPDKTIVGGFSQGAIMSAQIALSRPEAIDGIICISGMLLSEKTKPNSEHKEQYKKLKAFYGHGTEDQVLTIDKGRKCSAELTKSGIELTHKEYSIKHQISPQELKDIELWYKSNFLVSN